MKQIVLNTSLGQKAWQQHVDRKTGAADPDQLRSDALTLNAFGKPMSPREAVGVMLNRICRDGDKAVLRYARIFDGLVLRDPARIRVALSAHRPVVTAALRRALRMAANHIKNFHRKQLNAVTAEVRRPGVRLSELQQPLDRVGIYVPGGQAALVSTVLMNAIPATVAGVREIVMATPPGRDGRVPPALLAAAEMAGVTEMWCLGGAAAIGLMALGSQTFQRVDKIVGPGNVYVTEAKRQVVGHVGIDSLAGPSEIVVLADDSAKPEPLAWDLLAQGEHGAGAVALLLTPSPTLMRQVASAVKSLVQSHSGLLGAAAAVTLVLTPDLHSAVTLANQYAPEHLSLQVAKPRAWLRKIRRAGAIFIGSATPQSMGDYMAGTNHVLPTGGTSAWASPLSVRDFIRYTSVVEYTREGLRREGLAASTIAQAEGLTAHSESILQRVEAKA